LFESAKFETWKLIHSESHWFLVPTNDAFADEMRWLSREALFQMRQVEGFILNEWPILAAAFEETTKLLDLESYRRTKRAGATRGGG
jgi:hypothetical protein